MWITRQAYDDMREDLVTAQAEAKAQKDANATVVAALDWMRVRTTSLEKERAVLLEKFYDIKIPVPEYHKPTPAEGPFGTGQMHDLAQMFDGMNDAEAAKEGITHDETGRLVYTK